MRYTFHGFSQQKLLELDLDDRDAALLRYFVDFKDSGDMYSEEFEGEMFYWIKYEGIRKQLPILGNKLKKDSIYRRFKKMVEKGVLRHRMKKFGGSFSFYALGEQYYSLITSAEPSQPEIPFSKSSQQRSEGVGSKSEGVGSRSEGVGSRSEGVGSRSEGVGSRSGGGTDLDPEGYGSRSVPYNKSNKDKSNKKIERKKNPALALFNENFPKIKLNATQKDDIIVTATNLDAWKYTIWWWKFKEYRAERTDFMLDFYQNKAIPKLQQATQQPQEQAGKEQRSPPAPNNGISDTNGNMQTLWNTVLQTLGKRINRPSFNTWLKPTQLSSIADHSVQISVPDEIFVYWLEEYYEDAIAEALSKTLGFQPKLSFLVEAEKPKHTEPEQAKLWE